MDGFFSLYRGTSRHVIPTEGRGSVSMPAACFLCSFPLDGKSKIRHKSKEPKDQGQNHRPSARPPKRLTFKSGSDFCKVKRKRPSMKVKRLVVPWATAPPRFGWARAPIPVGLWRFHPRYVRFPPNGGNGGELIVTSGGK